jgi:hypothetical protein
VIGLRDPRAESPMQTAVACRELNATDIEVLKNVAHVEFTTRSGDSRLSPRPSTMIM